MRLRTLHSFATAALPLLLALPLACGDDGGDDGGENESVVYDNGWATQGVSDSVTSTSTGITSTTSTTEPTSGSGSGSTASSTSTNDSTGPGEPVVCTEDLTCNPGEVCVLPCCGGPAPACYSVDPGQDCQPGDTPDEGGVSCCQNEPDPDACMMMQWCIPGPCMADPPYCTPMDTINCSESSCDAPDGCYGQLNAGRLECSCK